MKILCVSDEVDPLVYSDSVKERFGDVDCVLGAGDLPLDYLEFIVSALNKPVYFVFGNHHTDDLNLYKGINFAPPPELNPARYFEPDSFAGAVHIGSGAVYESGALFAGLGGSMRYNDGANQFTEFTMMLEIIKIIPRLLLNRIRYGRYLDVLLTHAPPAGIHDMEDVCHRGFKSFLWFMNKFRPRYLVHGHIHLYDREENRTSVFDGTTVVNAYTHHVIELDAEMIHVRGT